MVRLVPGLDAVLVQEMFGQGAVPIHPGDDVRDAGKVGSCRLRRIREDLMVSADTEAKQSKEIAYL